MTTDEILSDLEDALDQNDLNSALIEELQGLITDQNDELAAIRDAIESLSLLWSTLRDKARAVVDQVPVEDREGSGWHEVTLASLRELDAASVVEVQKR